ncbi:unnamed protein product [Linum tenue]|uniref:Uncharacterized protein n=1 Tax=Linum tenue TaxID=586396 RepID=A0AAV0MM30_9ROSI|nr:unnamed protein product [Linum tenue]
MDPRISFSNDFADSTQQHKPMYESNYREAPVSSDFEFSVKDFALIPADEIFFKGVIVPLKEEDHQQGRRMMTLREELMVDVDHHHGQLPRVPKVSSGWWKEKLGLKRGGHNTNNVVVGVVGKRGERNGDGILERIEEKRASSFVHGERLSLGSAN